MILLNALKPAELINSPYLGTLSCEKVPKGYKNSAVIENYFQADHILESYKQQVYAIVHRGYNLYMHTQPMSIMRLKLPMVKE